PSTVARNCRPCRALHCTVVTGRCGSLSLRALRCASWRVAISFKFGSTLNIFPPLALPRTYPTDGIHASGFRRPANFSTFDEAPHSLKEAASTASCWRIISLRRGNVRNRRDLPVRLQYVAGDHHAH